LLIHLLSNGDYPDWAVTVAFYKAVHIVEAVFAADLRRDSTSHTDREQTRKIPKYKEVFKPYTHLFTASRVARYLESHDQGKFRTFFDFMDLTKVKVLISKRLYAVEQNSLQFLSDRGQSLVKVDPALI
jgi:hypothetical protein